MSNLEWIVLIWLAALGGCVGSFLNVVVYRLPAGKSLLHPGSRCPSCDKPIRAVHNIPVFGWLMLRGRCYDCHESISPRYPLVELVTALLFAGIALGVFYGGELSGTAAMADGLRWALVASLSVLGCCLISLTLILADKAKIPPLLIAVALVSALVSVALAWVSLFDAGATP